MVAAISLLRNVGRFENVSAGAALPFAKVTVVYAENARGKTTLSAILRSLGSGNASLVMERRRLGAAHPPHIVINLGARGNAVFQNGAWTQTAPELAIFDDNFVSDNVFSGVEVSPAHRQNLHELIVGAQGVVLNAQVQKHVAAVEEHNRDLKTRGDAIPAQKRGKFEVEDFCLLKPVPDIAAKIEDAERRLAAAKSAVSVANMATFSGLALPTIDLAAIEQILRRSLPDLDAAALSMVQKHLAEVGPRAENWISAGIRFTNEMEKRGQHDCPFCAQNLAGSPILAHYRGFFSEAYNGLLRDIAAVLKQFEQAHGGDIPATFERSVRQAAERRAFWKDFAEVPAIDIRTEDIAPPWRKAFQDLKALLERKAAAPLEVVAIPDALRSLVADHDKASQRIQRLSDELQAANPRLDIVKEQAKDANVATLDADLQELRAVEARYDPAIVPLCDAYLAERDRKVKTEGARQAARVALDTHRKAAFPAYGVAINNYLQRFNASFRVGPVDAVNNRAGSSANYSLLIDNNPVPLTSADGEHGFRNTLSAGDRNTLALAFFFASLDSDPGRVQKIVVIDDPMTSLDEHRTLHTLQEIERLATETAGVVVLSHSKPFLLQVWEKCKQIKKAALTVLRDGQTGSTIAPWDVNEAAITEHDRRYLATLAYLDRADPATERKVAESLRPMLETFARVAYPADFPPGSLLGPFHHLCVQRLGKPDEIMSAADARELRALLDFGNRYHHDENRAYATEIINDAELADFTRRTLKFIRR